MRYISAKMLSTKKSIPARSLMKSGDTMSKRQEFSFLFYHLYTFQSVEDFCKYI